jgi:membrane-bound lytic murein transglycosylase F
VPVLPDHPISSRRRYDRFGTSPWEACYSSSLMQAMRPPLRSAPRLERRRFARRLTAAAAVAMTLASCAPSQSALEQIRSRGELRVVMLNAPTSYYLGAHGPQGFEFRLASAFAQQLGVRLTVQGVGDSAAVRAALRHGRADMAAAQISVDSRWLRIGDPTDSYQDLSQLVIQGRGKSHPRDITGLRNARIVVEADSPQLNMLRSIRNNGVPDLNWKEVPADKADLLQLVSDGTADYAIMDANEFEFAQHLYPEASVAFTLPDTRPLRWMVRSGATDLAQAANQFLADARTSGALTRITAQASAESGEFDLTDARRFRADIAERLPELRATFEEAAAATGLDWRLLAAVGYQESRWQMQAASNDGARGIMMLTNDAASTWRRRSPTCRSVSPSRITPGSRSRRTTPAMAISKMHACWRRCAARIRIVGTTCTTSCRCWRKKCGIRGSSAVTRAAGSPRASSIRCGSTWQCWSGATRPWVRSRSRVILCAPARCIRSLLAPLREEYLQ